MQKWSDMEGMRWNSACTKDEIKDELEEAIKNGKNVM